MNVQQNNTFQDLVAGPQLQAFHSQFITTPRFQRLTRSEGKIVGVSSCSIAVDGEPEVIEVVVPIYTAPTITALDPLSEDPQSTLTLLTMTSPEVKNYVDRVLNRKQSTLVPLVTQAIGAIAEKNYVSLLPMVSTLNGNVFTSAVQIRRLRTVWSDAIDQTTAQVISSMCTGLGVVSSPVDLKRLISDPTVLHAITPLISKNKRSEPNRSDDRTLDIVKL